MTQAKHTPGPWTVSEFFPSGNKADDLIFIEPNIAHIERKIAGHDQNDMADARLIAAAPELLEALKDVIGWVPGGFAWHTDASFNAVERARAAIAKAEGAA